MRPLSYFILAYIALGLQLGLAPYIGIGSSTPNLVLICVVFIAINAGREPALLGCFGLGALQDILSQQPLGLHAFAYGIVGMFIVWAQEMVYRDHPLTHFSMTFIGGIITMLVMVVHGWIRPAAAAVQTNTGVYLPAIRASTSALFGSAIYSAILSVPVLAGLQRIRKVFAFHLGRRKMRM